MTGPNLCAVCVATVLDPHIPHYVQTSTIPAELGKRVARLTPEVAERIVDGSLVVGSPYGGLSMLPVTTVNGTLMCATCASNQLRVERGLPRSWR